MDISKAHLERFISGFEPRWELLFDDVMFLLDNGPPAGKPPDKVGTTIRGHFGGEATQGFPWYRVLEEIIRTFLDSGSCYINARVYIALPHLKELPNILP